MSRSHPALQQRLLSQLAQLVVSEGYDVPEALARAARKEGIGLHKARPSAAAIHDAIRAYRELFRPEQLLQLETQRRRALEAMHSLREFEPRLTGSLVHGDGGLETIRLLLDADPPEQVMLHLNDRHIPWQASEARLHYAGNLRITHPMVRFMAGDTRIELVLLGPDRHSNPPRNGIDGKRLETLDIQQLEALTTAR